ncbi:protein scribble homolog, partial [Talpa occidentalis]|uniref:protein scribble homolog n=1 Tax=Talpa occidentalis TaxID=50954 RepID=UPI0023F71BF9
GWSRTPALSAPQVSPGVIANPFAAGAGRRNSLDSISSVDREMSPEGLGKEKELPGSSLPTPPWGPEAPAPPGTPGATLARASCSPGQQQTKPGVIQPLAQAWPRGPPAPGGRGDPRTVSAPPAGVGCGRSSGAAAAPPSPPSPDALPTNVKQAYRTFAAVPGPALPLPQDGPAQTALPGPAAPPEQLSFRERQKYFELEVRLPQAEGPPKRVSLVGADDLRKMQEEEARKLQQKRAQLLSEAAAEEPEEELPWAGSGPASGPGPVSSPPPGGSAPVRTAKAERRHQERLRVQSPELPAPERALSPAERRALEAEKRALWRAARMKSLEQDALRAQMVLSKSQEGRSKRGPLERLPEAPSPAPTPSPTPLEDLGPQTITSPGRLSPDFVEELRSLDPSPSPGPQEEDGEVAMVLLGRPSPAARPEEVALCSSRRPVRPGRRGLGPVPS